MTGDGSGSLRVPLRRLPPYAHRHPRRHGPRRQQPGGPARQHRLRRRHRVAVEVPGDGGARPPRREVARADRPADVRRQHRRRRLRPRRDRHAVGLGGDHGAGARGVPAGQGRHLDGQRPRAGRPRVPAARPAARQRRRPRPGGRAELPRRRRPAPPAGPGARPPRRADRLRRADLRRRPGRRADRQRDRRQDPRLPAARRRRAVQRHGDRGVHGRAAAAQRALQDPRRPEADRHQARPAGARWPRRRRTSPPSPPTRSPPTSTGE